MINARKPFTIALACCFARITFPYLPTNFGYRAEASARVPYLLAANRINNNILTLQSFAEMINLVF